MPAGDIPDERRQLAIAAQREFSQFGVFARAHDFANLAAVFQGPAAETSHIRVTIGNDITARLVMENRAFSKLAGGSCAVNSLLAPVGASSR